MQTIKIEGMVCEGCVSRVSKALNALDGVKAEVSLENKCAEVEFCGSANLEQAIEAIEDLGFDVV